MLAERYGVPVTVSVSSADAMRRSPAARLAMRALDHLDHAFTCEATVAHALREGAPNLPLSIVAPAASALPWPTRRGLDSVARALKGIRPGRLVIATPWPENRNDLRWFRDIVVPQLDARPVCLLLGVPSRRTARLLIGAMGMHNDFRVHSGKLTADVIASAARCVDAFVVCAARVPVPTAPDGQLAIALATGGVPVVTNAAQDARVLAHERNAFVVEPGDEHGYVHTLNQILSLPAVQRHFLGEEFARLRSASGRGGSRRVLYGTVRRACRPPADPNRPPRRLVTPTRSNGRYNSAAMDDTTLPAVCELFDLGAPIGAPTAVSGGLTNRLWRVTTTNGVFAVKQMNRDPDRADYVAWFDRAFTLEQAAFRAGIPMPRPVPVASTGGCLGELQLADTSAITVRVHEWVEGEPLSNGEIYPPEVAARVAVILANIHALGLTADADACTEAPRVR
jgi:hypothetical protein